MVHNAGDRNCRLFCKPGKRINHGQGVAGNVNVIGVVLGYGCQALSNTLVRVAGFG
jgi:hypothetical protein